MRKLLPVILTFLGLAAGAGTGVLLQPKPSEDGHAAAESSAASAEHSTPVEHGENHASQVPKDDGHAAQTAQADDGHGGAAQSKPDDSIEVVGGASGGHGEEGESGGFEYVKLSNQFVVPLVEHGQVTSMMVLTLSLEVSSGGGDTVYGREPKLRDALLQVLFNHANADGFKGRYTDAEEMLPLRRALREAAMKVLPGTVNDVLIADIVRHDS
jgi:flagellar protein FliL